MTNSTKYDWLVVGGGFKSLIAAYSMARRGQTVLLLERSKSLGGFMAPLKWGDFWIDKGPQFFDNFEQADLSFITEMVGEDIFEDIGFKYTSYMNGHKTDGFAIPDWRSYGADFCANVFADLFAQQITDQKSEISSFDDLLCADGGAELSETLGRMTQKFLRRDAKDLSQHARKMTTYVGRKLLFDQDTSIDLKQSPLLDGLLAAQKKVVTETRFNLYPRGSNLETVRAAMERAVRDIGVDVVLECGDLAIDVADQKCSYDTGTVQYGRAFFGCDPREAEKMVFGTNTLLEQTHMLPEVFHCFSVPGDSLDPAYYLVDYDPDHFATRMTNFSNYMTAYDDEGYGVFCVEEPIDAGSAEWDTPDLHQAQVFREAQEAGNIDCDHYKAAKSFRIPVTYRVPLAGFEAAAEGLAKRTEQVAGDSLVIPNPMSLTRKETMDDLRALDLLDTPRS